MNHRDTQQGVAIVKTRMTSTELREAIQFLRGSADGVTINGIVQRNGYT